MRIYPIPPHLPIDVIRTQEAFGYSPTSIAPGQNKKVICICKNCEQPFAIRRKSVEYGSLCGSCRTSEGWKGRETIIPALDAASVLVDEETEKRFGYKATTLSPYSFKRVVGRCSCGELFERIRRNVIPNAICVSCSYKGRMSEASVAKRTETFLKKYGTVGIPIPPGSYGKIEDELARYLQVWTGEQVIRQKPLVGGLRLDFFLPQRKIGIEYCGLFWHNEMSPTPRGPQYHKEKMIKCAAEGTRLITIFEDEWKGRNEQCKGILRAQIGSFDKKIDARKGKVREISLGESRKFLNEQHLQGAVLRSNKAWGFYAEETLFAVMTFGPHPRQSHENVIILDRFAITNGVHIPGGASKLFSAAQNWLRETLVERIVSWSDNRWSTGGVYTKLGFTLAEDLPPDYSYVKAACPRERFSKQSQKKDRTACPQGLTESAWAAQRGLVRIWDCGKKRWEKEVSVAVGEVKPLHGQTVSDPDSEHHVSVPLNDVGLLLDMQGSVLEDEVISEEVLG
jgi:hypothetical protein